MAKRFCDSELWQKEWFQNLSLINKVFLKYIFENCDCAGVWNINYRLASFIIGAPVTEKNLNEINAANNLFEKFDDDKIFIIDFIKFQYGNLSENCKPHKSIIEKLKKYGLYERVSKGYPKGMDTLPNTLEEKDTYKEKEKEQDTKKGNSINTNSCTDTLIEKKEEENKKEEEKVYGECCNVHLSQEHYSKLLNEILSEKALKELIDELSLNIARGKAPPYNELQPDCHYACLKIYWRNKKLNTAKPVSSFDRAKQFKDELDKLTEEYRLKEVESG